MACVSNYAGYTNCLIDDFINDISGQGSEAQRELDVRVISKNFKAYANSEYAKLRQESQTETYQHRPPQDQFFFIFAGYTNNVRREPKIRVVGFTEGLPSPLPPFTVVPEDYRFYPCGIKDLAVYWMLKIDRVKRLDTIDVKTLKALTILIFIETIRATAFVGPPLDIVTIKPVDTPDKITISKIELEQVEKKMDTVIGAEILLDKLTQLEGNLP
jgi:hypothetical protein